jgi:hypothetical protein
MTRLSKLLSLTLIPLIAHLGCLPEDNRPPPGRLIVTVSSEPEHTAALFTADGWEITYNRFLLCLGHIRLDPGGPDRDCDPYSVTFYVRILDMLRSGPQTVATAHALGQCQLGFSLWSPLETAVLGQGVSTDDEELIRAVAGDAFVRSNGVVVHVAGVAAKLDRVVRFRWSFRQNFGYSGCSVVAFRAGATERVDLQVRGTTLFRDPLDDTGTTLRFEPYAMADTNADGDVTLEELNAVPAGEDGASTNTLAERLYLELVPQLVRVGDRTCFDGPVFADPVTDDL